MSKTLLIYGAIFCVIIVYLWNCQQNVSQSESFTPNVTKITNNNSPYLYPTQNDIKNNNLQKDSKSYRDRINKQEHEK